MEKTKLPEAPKLNCANCKHCGEHATALVCRAKPPVASAALLMGPQGPSWQTVTAWPVVTNFDWCSHHSPKLDS